MGHRILIVEDQFLNAISLEDEIIRLGHHVVGVAASKMDVERIEDTIDIALVDLNLLDGRTGIEIGRALAAKGSQVIFVTANPAAVADGVEGTLGVATKPLRDDDLENIVNFAIDRLNGIIPVPPSNLHVFCERGAQ